MVLPVKAIASEVATKTKAKAKKVYQSKKDDKTLRNVGIGVAVSIATFFTGRAIIRSVRKNKAEKEATNDPNIQQAMLLRAAMNPGGYSWLMASDGTNEAAIYRIAANITDFNAVAKQYKNLYSSSLISDLQKELSGNEYAKFLNIVNSKKENGIQNDTNAVHYTEQKMMVKTLTKTKIYTDKTWFSTPYVGYEIPANKILLGFTTGKEYPLAFLGYFGKLTAVEIILKTHPNNKMMTVFIDKKDIEFIKSVPKGTKLYKVNESNL